MARCDTGSLLADAGDLAAAREAFDRARALYERVGDEQGLAQALNGLARVDRLEGRVAEAIECHGRALETFDRVGDKLRVAETLEALAVAHAAAGERAGAEEHLRMADEVRDAIGAPRPPVQRAEVAAALGRG